MCLGGGTDEKPSHTRGDDLGVDRRDGGRRELGEDVRRASACDRSAGGCPHLFERRRTNRPEELPGLPSSRRSWSVLAADLWGRAPTCGQDQGRRRRPTDAAMVCRSSLRQVLERHGPERVPDRHDREVGRWRIAGRQSARSADARRVGRRLGHRHTGHGVRAADALRGPGERRRRLSARHRADALH
jgi:hypothetical protein